MLSEGTVPFAFNIPFAVLSCGIVFELLSLILITCIIISSIQGVLAWREYDLEIPGYEEPDHIIPVILSLRCPNTGSFPGPVLSFLSPLT